MIKDEKLRKWLRINNAIDTVMWFATGIKHPSMYEDHPNYHEYYEGLVSGFNWKINAKVYKQQNESLSKDSEDEVVG